MSFSDPSGCRPLSYHEQAYLIRCLIHVLLACIVTVVVKLFLYLVIQCCGGGGGSQFSKLFQCIFPDKIFRKYVRSYILRYWPQSKDLFVWLGTYVKHCKSLIRCKLYFPNSLKYFLMLRITIGTQLKSACLHNSLTT